ncbi:43954_t:CDS:2 [Gigaspora margarita]|uniref:43954_t:CDS:1 n=1 Tax=Gigaspora margarita TaxID=4874 RepID=A0ABN7VVQ5_GIGMA|nr:43954_t:CDS:2 [Gigaspora margarita]
MRAKVEWSPIKEDIKRKLKANWVLPLRNGQLARITAGRSERIELEKRRQIHTRIRNLPKFTKEVLLLRQLRDVNAKAVHIFQNKNEIQEVSQVEKDNHNRRECQKEKETRKKEKIPQTPNERVNKKEEIDQERHRLKELAQRLVEKIKKKLI